MSSPASSSISNSPPATPIGRTSPLPSPTSILVSNTWSSVWKEKPEGTLSCVSFEGKTRTVLIATRKERAAGSAIASPCWNAGDYESFKLSAVAEVEACMDEHNVDSKKAMTDLYQPKPSDLI